MSVDLSGVDLQELQKKLTPRLTKYIRYDPTPKQSAFLLMNNAKEILYGGAAGGGKSVAQLMGALQFVDIPGYSAILFRRTYADLSLPGALIDMSKSWLMPFVESKEVRWSEKEKQYTFPSGATLNFGYLESANDCFRYQGAEFQYIGMDEVTHIDPANYRYLFSRLRKPKTLQVPLRFRATANPGGLFGEYYYQRFFIEGPEKGRIFIGAGLDDNPYLDADAYRESLEELDPIERERLLNGNWEIKTAGDMFNRHWFSIVPASDVPSVVKRVRFWDMASTDPTKRKTKSRDKREPDWTVGFKLAMCQGIYWIEDIIRVQKMPHEVETIIGKTAREDGYSCAIRMEQEPGSSGVITIDHYARNVLQGYDFVGVVSTGSKVERARTASSASQAGKVLIVNRCRNMLPFLDEADVFPYGLKDDTIDGFSGAFNYFRTGTLLRAPSSIKKAGGSYWSKFRGY
jgi:phage terminase large subunit-like protein